jgi:hypothetical protein
VTLRATTGKAPASIGNGPLELSFSTTELRDICEKRMAAMDALGTAAALELEKRLADIEALETVADLASLFPDATVDRSPVERSLRLTTGQELVFRSGHATTPTTPTGATDWAKVNRMRIMAIEIDNG